MSRPGVSGGDGGGGPFRGPARGGAGQAPGVCRGMTRGDIPEIRGIEERAYRYPWSRAVFADCLRAGYHCRVLQLSTGIGAYGILSAAAGEAHILNLCVRPEWAGRGLARRLLAHLLETAGAQGADTVFLEVRPSNRRAIELYEKNGFVEIGRRPDYYPAVDGREDAILMGKPL